MLLGHLVRGLSSGCSERLVEIARIAVEAEEAAASATASAREALAAAKANDAASLEVAADAAQDQIGTARMLADKALYLIPSPETPAGR